MSGWDATTYDPSSGARFLTRDPAEAESRQPYGYVGGNPLNATDPSGLICLGSVCTNGVTDALGDAAGATGRFIKRNATVDNALTVGGIVVSGALIVGTGGAAAVPYLVAGSIAISGAQTYRACRGGVDAGCAVAALGSVLTVGGTGVGAASSRLALSDDVAQAMSRAFGSASPFVRDPLMPFSQALGAAELVTNFFGLGSDFLRNNWGQAC